VYGVCTAGSRMFLPPGRLRPLRQFSSEEPDDVTCSVSGRSGVRQLKPVVRVIEPPLTRRSGDSPTHQSELLEQLRLVRPCQPLFPAHVRRLLAIPDEPVVRPAKLPTSVRTEVIVTDGSPSIHPIPTSFVPPAPHARHNALRAVVPSETH